MECPRCRGRMFAEKFYDFVRSFDAWKCTCCGEVLDSTILATGPAITTYISADSRSLLNSEQKREPFRGFPFCLTGAP